jgi:hypothetical protein
VGPATTDIRNRVGVFSRILRKFDPTGPAFGPGESRLFDLSLALLTYGSIDVICVVPTTTSSEALVLLRDFCYG